MRQTCDILFPILKARARVVNLSSVSGRLQNIPSPALRQKLATSNSTLTKAELDQMMNAFVQATRDGNHTSLGWPNSPYVVSKVINPISSGLFDRVVGIIRIAKKFNLLRLMFWNDKIFCDPLRRSPCTMKKCIIPLIQNCNLFSLDIS